MTRDRTTFIAIFPSTICQQAGVGGRYGLSRRRKPPGRRRRGGGGIAEERWRARGQRGGGGLPVCRYSFLLFSFSSRRYSLALFSLVSPLLRLCRRRYIRDFSALPVCFNTLTTSPSRSALSSLICSYPCARLEALLFYGVTNYCGYGSLLQHRQATFTNGAAKAETARKTVRGKIVWLGERQVVCWNAVICYRLDNSISCEPTLLFCSSACCYSHCMPWRDGIFCLTWAFRIIRVGTVARLRALCAAMHAFFWETVEGGCIPLFHSHALLSVMVFPCLPEGGRKKFSSCYHPTIHYT